MLFCCFCFVVVDVVNDDDDVAVLSQKPFNKSLVKMKPVIDEMLLFLVLLLFVVLVVVLWLVVV